MLKNASINTRIDAGLKSQAESVLNEPGMSMATAMPLYLKQIVLHRGIPFYVCLPQRCSLFNHGNIFMMDKKSVKVSD